MLLEKSDPTKTLGTAGLPAQTHEESKLTEWHQHTHEVHQETASMVSGNKGIQ